MKTKNELNILLVDDNPLNQKLIIINLKKLGYNIDVAENGLLAVEMTEKRRYDLIIMDIMMPVMNGLSATKKIRDNESKLDYYTPIIGLTANTYDSDRENCLNQGMDEYMVKPFNLDIFKEIINKLGVVN